jgi:hypothetical protein
MREGKMIKQIEWRQEEKCMRLVRTIYPIASFLAMRLIILQ